MYQNLVKTVKDAFEIDEVVKVDCRELERSDMKKVGAKLRVNPYIKLHALHCILASSWLSLSLSDVLHSYRQCEVLLS